MWKDLTVILFVRLAWDDKFSLHFKESLELCLFLVLAFVCVWRSVRNSIIQRPHFFRDDLFGTWKSFWFILLDFRAFLWYIRNLHFTFFGILLGWNNLRSLSGFGCLVFRFKNDNFVLFLLWYQFLKRFVCIDNLLQVFPVFCDNFAHQSDFLHPCLTFHFFHLFLMIFSPTL